MGVICFINTESGRKCYCDEKRKKEKRIHDHSGSNNSSIHIEIDEGPYDSKIGSKYLDDKTKTLMPCYENCLTCDIGGKSTEMNCLTCKNNFKFYKKTKNCLNCKKYVNYEQTGCIDEIPEGYYLEDSNLGTIGKCHELCKTCEKKSIIE